MTVQRTGRNPLHQAYSLGLIVTNNLLERVTRSVKRKADPEWETQSSKAAKSVPTAVKLAPTRSVRRKADVKWKTQSLKAAKLAPAKVSFIFNGMTHHLEAESFVGFESGMLEASVDTAKGTLIGNGSYGKVYKCSMDTVGSQGRKQVDIAVKVPTVEDIGQLDITKEGMAGQITAGTPNVTGGALLIRQNQQFYLIQRLYASDARNLSQKASGMLTQETTMSFLGDVLKGAQGLENLHIFHVDIKPANILVDFSDKLSIADLGGTLYLPPLEEMTPDLLRKQLSIFANSPEAEHIEFVAKMNKRIDLLTTYEKIHLVLYCQTSGCFSPVSTLFTSNSSLTEKIDKQLEYFQTWNSKHKSEKDVIQAYDDLKTLLRCQMVHQLAATSLCLMSVGLESELDTDRKKGFYQGTGIDPLSSERIRATVRGAQVKDKRVGDLFCRMIDSEKKPISPTQSYQEFTQIKGK